MCDLRMKTVLALMGLLALCSAQKQRRQPSSEWDYRSEGEDSHQPSLALQLDYEMMDVLGTKTSLCHVCKLCI